MYAMLAANYGSMKKGKSYLIKEDGLDWVRVLHNGKVCFVPKSFLEKDPISKIYSEDDTEECYEDFIY